MRCSSKVKIFFLLSLVILCSGACQTYRQNILFRTDQEIIPERVRAASIEASRNYQIQANDLLKVEVFTHKGERIIDPDFELSANLGRSNTTSSRDRTFMVQSDGLVDLPIAGPVQLSGLTLEQANKMLEEVYSSHYKDVYVTTNYVNKRVVILGANGGQVLPLTNENMHLIEVLAMYGGVGNNARAHNIRLIRGDLNDPEVRLIDLTTIEGMKKSNLQVRPGDIIYVEPVRKPLHETIRDIAPVLSFVTSVTTVTLLMMNLFSGSGSN
jgi:polysaccharide biosynthesis/export protein